MRIWQVRQLRTTIMENKLKPCPNPECGGLHVNVRSEAVLQLVHVHCKECGMRGPASHVAEHAIEFWQKLPRSPVWSKELPTEPDGFYIARSIESKQRCLMQIQNGSYY